MKRQILATGLLLALWVPARAADLVVTVTPQPTSPVALNYCSVQKQFVPLARGVSVEGFRTGVVFKNVGTAPVVSIVFLFTMRDAGGAVIDSHTQTSKGTFAPGLEIDNIHWLTVDSWPTLGGVDCAIDHVVFADGSSWPAP